MIRLAAVLLYLILSPNGFLANQDCAESDGYFDSLAEEGSHCGAYCFSAMKPVLGYVKANQNRLDTCEKASRLDLSEINRQLKDVKQSLESKEKKWKESFEKSLQKTLKEHIPGNLGQLLANIERQLSEVKSEQKKINSELTKIQDTLSNVAAVARTGSKFYYIEEEPIQQQSTNTCRQMGGHLASVQINETKDHPEYRKLKS